MEAADLDGVDWGRLSLDALWTVSRVAIPIADGESYADAARRLGLSKAVVGRRLAQLRAELLAQLDEAAT